MKKKTFIQKSKKNTFIQKSKSYLGKKDHAQEIGKKEFSYRLVQMNTCKLDQRTTGLTRPIIKEGLCIKKNTFMELRNVLVALNIMQSNIENPYEFEMISANEFIEKIDSIERGEHFF